MSLGRWSSWLLFTGVVFIGIPTAARDSGVQSIKPTSGRLIWLFTGSGLTRLASFSAGRRLLHGVLNSRNTWIFGQSRFIPPEATMLCGGTSVAAAIRAAKNGDNKGVVLDIEHWRFTPVAQQHDPVGAYRRAGLALKVRGKFLIATPAFDLVRVLEPRYHGRIYPEFLRLKLAINIARYSAVYEIQSQGAEANLRLYRYIVRAIARQVYASNPHALILAGLTTSGQTRGAVNVEELYHAVTATRNIVNGYWINIPAKGPYCPRCGKPHPRLAIALLDRIYRRNPR
jgi:hypothetical protein